VRKISQAHMA